MIARALAALLCCVGDAGLALVQLVVLAVPAAAMKGWQHMFGMRRHYIACGATQGNARIVLKNLPSTVESVLMLSRIVRTSL
jgi:hypothetical protein